jgi:hypothetical protein
MRHRAFLGFLLLELGVLSCLVVDGRLAVQHFERRALPAQRELVERLSLTDLALWTEARYTRHPSQADRFAPFQDFPSSLEHFPAGSIIAPIGAVDEHAGEEASGVERGPRRW